MGLSHPWVSAYHLLEWLEKRQLGKAGAALSAVLRSLMDSLVKLPQPFWMVVREASAAQAALSLVLAPAALPARLPGAGSRAL